jgi:peptidase E
MDEPKGPKPIYLLAGGAGSRRFSRDPVLSRAIESCGVKEPTIAYIGAASGDNKAFFKMISVFMHRAGAGEVALAPLVGKRVKIEKTRETLESADMIFVSGGDVEEGMAALAEHDMLPFLRGLHAGGKPFAGLSAGSIMLAKEWIVWDDPDDDSTASLFPCMGLARVYCDTHGEDEEWEELRALLRLVPEGMSGYGITSGAGLVVRPGGALEALGGPVHCFAKIGGRVVREPDLAPARAPEEE